MYVFNFSIDLLVIKCNTRVQKLKLEYIKLLRTTSNSFWLMYFFSLDIGFSCIDALLHSFEIWSSNDNRLSIVIPKRVTEFSDLISLSSIRSFSGIIFFVDFCRSINWNLSGIPIYCRFGFIF